MKIVIFEGVDKIGKTTAIQKAYEKLKEDGFIPMMLNLPYTFDGCHKLNALSTFRLKQTFETIRGMKNYFDDDYVLLVDRFHLSEYVYDTVLRPTQAINTFVLSMIDEKMLSINALLIYLTTSNIGKVYDTFVDKDALIDGLTWKQYFESHVMFEEIYSASLMNKIKIDRNESVFIDVAIREYIEKKSEV